MTENNYSQFCDLYADDQLVGTTMAYLVFRPDGTVVNADEMLFKVPRKITGVSTFRLLGQVIPTSWGGTTATLRAGDTVRVVPGGLTLTVLPQRVAS